jgi:uncharacterized cupredoxin-like copper-binding protein
MELPRPLLVAVLLTLVLTTLATACGSNASSEPVRSYAVPLQIDDTGDQYKYVASGDIPDFTVGDEVTFVVQNTGHLDHDLAVLAPSGDVAGTAPAVSPGQTLELTVLLDAEGLWRLDCNVDDHLTRHKMQTLIQVAPAT